jgi:drug/metabolite transporter (DMT)-like permease
MIGPELALAVTVTSGGLATVLLRQAVVGGRTDEARFHRAAAQTVCVLVGVLVLLGPAGLLPLGTGAAFAALNGAFGAVAFILFSKGLETVEASTGKPALVVSMVVAAGLGILVLGEGVSAPKLAGIGLVGTAVFLLAGE